MKYEFPWPMWIIFYKEQQGTRFVFLEEKGKGTLGIALFKEKLLAERYRDGCHPKASIGPITDIEMLRRNVVIFKQYTEATHVAIDHEESKPQTVAIWVRLEDI